MYVDISEYCAYDLGTGIQRVVREVLATLLENPPPDYDVAPVYIAPDGVCRHANRLAFGLHHCMRQRLLDSAIEPQGGDVFLAVDLALRPINYGSENYVQSALLQLKALGVPVFFVLYDLLPILRPSGFAAEHARLFRQWANVAATVADGIICISRSVADDVVQWMPRASIRRREPLKIGYFHLGTRFAALRGQRKVHNDEPRELRDALTKPTFLMVGTVEPRKGHRQVLEGFELLWKAGFNANLVIVGKQGWMVEDVVAHITHHPRFGRQLHWFAKADDAMLTYFYSKSSALLAASEGEGFGLPLIEAAAMNVPIIARDLPVFREIAGEHAIYFDGLKARDVASVVADWLTLSDCGAVPSSAAIRRNTWKESTEELLSVVLANNWYKLWRPSKRHLRRH